VCDFTGTMGIRVSDWRAAVLSFRPHHGAVAQLVAHLVRNEGVRGSSPLSSTDITAGQRPSPDPG
jgi:hypothetical protein